MLPKIEVTVRLVGNDALEVLQSMHVAEQLLGEKIEIDDFLKMLLIMGLAACRSEADESEKKEK